MKLSDWPRICQFVRVLYSLCKWEPPFTGSNGYSWDAHKIKLSGHRPYICWKCTTSFWTLLINPYSVPSPAHQQCHKYLYQIVLTLLYSELGQNQQCHKLEISSHVTKQDNKQSLPKEISSKLASKMCQMFVTDIFFYLIFIYER